MKSLPLALTVAALAVATTSLASSPVGTYIGVVKINTASIPKNLPAEQKKMVDTQLAMAAKVRITLKFESGGKYSSSISGGPKSESSTGTWAQKGNELTLTPKVKNGQAVTSKQSQKMQLSSDGKTITINSNPNASVVFTKK